MIVVFDVGATHTRMGLVNSKQLGEVRQTVTHNTKQGFGLFLQELQQFLAGRKPEAVVGCFPGQIVGEAGILSQATNLSHWNGLALKAALQQLAHCPVYLEHDVALGGLGEAWVGAGSRDGVMAYFTISTGVNAVRLVQGRLDMSIAQYDIGRQLIPDSDGKLVTLEHLTGGAALQARRGKAPRELHDPRIWLAEERHLAVGVYNTLIHWRPDLVVFGGSMMRDIELDEVRSSLLKLPRIPMTLPPFRRAKLGDTAGLHGALAWYTQR